MAESTGKQPGATKAYVDAQIAAEATTRANAISSETSTRAAADSAEVTNRNSAITSAVADEATARDSAIATAVATALASLKQHRAGDVSILIGDINLGVVAKRVNFATPLPNADYQVMPCPNGLTGVFTVSGQDANGFTLNITSAVVGTVGYIAVQE